MFYTVEVFDEPYQQWEHWSETSFLDKAQADWQGLTDAGRTARVREVRDLNRGKEWIG